MPMIKPFVTDRTLFRDRLRAGLDALTAQPEVDAARHRRLSRPQAVLRLPRRRPRPARHGAPGIDYVKLSESTGVPALRVDRYAELAAAVDQALAAQGPILFSVAMDATLRSLLSA